MIKKEMYAMMKSVIAETEASNRDEMIKFIEKEISLLEKKNSKSGPTKTQKENEILKAEIVEALKEIGQPVTVSEFQSLTRFKVENGFSNQKMSAMLNQLAKAEIVVKTVEKKKSYFAVVQ